MDIILISGSPRKESNTDYLLKHLEASIGGKFIKLSEYQIAPCNSCWSCRNINRCIIDDDMTNTLVPLLLKMDVIVLGSPVYFNNVSAQVKKFMDRTWCIRGELNNKIGGAIVVGRRYGAENALTAINSFFLKHNMIPANRGVSGIAFQKNDIKDDQEAIQATQKLGNRINELAEILDVT